MKKQRKPIILLDEDSLLSPEQWDRLLEHAKRLPGYVGTVICKPISRSEALAISLQTLDRAERERSEAVTLEAERTGSPEYID